MKIPYGESNFEKIVINNFYYVDRTHYIEILENLSENYLVFLRPRRFGKSLFCSMLSYYYDVQYKDRFDEFFGEYYIGKKPTKRKNSYLVLKFDFSGIETDTNDKLYYDFSNKIARSITHCLSMQRLANQNQIDKICAHKTPASMIGELLDFIELNYGNKLYVIIDEYDLFANELLAFKPDEFKQHFGSTGFVRKFYEQIKEGTQRGTVDRVFITGVTPIAMDSLSSGFNITKNITTLPEFNQMLGFTGEEVRTIIQQICTECQEVRPLDCQKMFDDLCRYYDGYLFSKDSVDRVFNPDMILYFVSDFIRSERCKYPDNLIDNNIISDYTKIQQMFKIGDYEKNLAVIDQLLNQGEVLASLIDTNLISETTNWKFGSEDKFVSLIYFLGIISIKRAQDDDIVFQIPNYVIEKLYLQFFLGIIQEKTDVDLNIRELKRAISAMAHKGEVELLIKSVEKLLHHLSNRDYIKFDEKYIKLLIFSYLSLTKMYVTKSEYEVEDGYIDLLMLRRPPYEAKYQFAFEVKYRKKGDISNKASAKTEKKPASAKKLTKEQDQKKKKLEAKYNEALEQLQKYRESDEFASTTNLKTYILIFVGDKCEVCEEVVDSSDDKLSTQGAFTY